MVKLLSVEEFYAAGKVSGKLLGLKCEKGHITLPPRHSCIECRSLSLSITELSGRGTVLESTKVCSKSKDFPLEEPYFLAMVKLEEGPNLLGVLEQGIPPTKQPRVEVKFKTLAGETRPRIFFQVELDLKESSG